MEYNKLNHELSFQKCGGVFLVSGVVLTEMDKN